MNNLTTTEIITIKALGLKMEELVDITMNLPYGSDYVAEQKLKQIFIDVNQGKEIQFNKPMERSKESDLDMSIYSIVCELSVALDLILYKYTGVMSDYLYDCYETNAEVDLLADYDFNLSNYNNSFDFNFKFDKGSSGFTKLAFKSSILNNSGITFVSAEPSGDFWKCRVSLSKSDISKWALEVIDSEDPTKISKTNNRKLF